MGQVIEDLQDEIRYALGVELPRCEEDWASFKVHRAMLRTAALLSGRAFVGPGLNRNEEFLHAATMYTIDSFVLSTKLHGMKPVLRPFHRWLIPESKAVDKHLQTMRHLITPLLLDQWKADGVEKTKNNMVAWNLKNSPPSLRKDLDFQALQQLQASFAAVHTTTKLLTNIVFDLAARPEYMDPLREELRLVLDESGGILTKSSMAKLRKLDSFMAEVQRRNPPGVMTFNRTIQSPITLSNGLYLPKGTWIATATHSIANDPGLWEEPGKFDGFRFDKLCAESGKASKYQVSFS
jgi:ent-kaurene oxidase